MTHTLYIISIFLISNLLRFVCFTAFMQGLVTFVVSSRVTLRARANGLHRSSSTLPERNAPGQMRQTRVRIRPSVPSLYYQTMQLPIGSAGSEFSRRASLQRTLRSSVSVFFWNVDLVWRLSENDKERNSFREYDKRGGWPFFFL